MVGSDLELLRTLTDQRLPSHAEVRAAAAILRRLLIDGPGELARVWRSIAGEAHRDLPLTVTAVDLDEQLNSVPDPTWVFAAYAGGADTGKIAANHGGQALCSVPTGHHDGTGEAPSWAQQEFQLKTMTISHWLRSTSIAITTKEVGLVRISRAGVVRYVANRKGGVHFTPGRRKTISKKQAKQRK